MLGMFQNLEPSQQSLGPIWCCVMWCSAKIWTRLLLSLCLWLAPFSTSSYYEPWSLCLRNRQRTDFSSSWRREPFPESHHGLPSIVSQSGSSPAPLRPSVFPPRLLLYSRFLLHPTPPPYSVCTALCISFSVLSLWHSVLWFCKPKMLLLSSSCKHPSFPL